MYHDFEVGLPKVKGKIITRKKGAATYILYQYGSKYNPEKKYAVPQRTIIGKVNPEHPVSYTHLDVYKRQIVRSLFGELIDMVKGPRRI